MARQVGDDQAAPVESAQTTPSEPTPRPALPPTPEPSPTPEPVATPDVPTPTQVYAQIVDSVVYIETEDKTSGTGFVIDGGWVVTNAHVVERFGEVRVGRSDGVDLGLYPVHATDWILDLAIVGPIADPELEPFDRVATADLAIGDPVMLVGFPDESLSLPTPTLTSGIVSLRRQPAIGDFPFLQVDATIAPGQSGGALVDRHGNLAGISGLEFGRGEFGLAFEADAMWPRIDAMLADPNPPLPSTNPVFSFTEEVGPIRFFGFMIDVEPDGVAQVTAVGDEDIYIDLRTVGDLTVASIDEDLDPFEALPSDAQDYFFIDETGSGGEALDAEVDPGLYQVVIGSYGSVPDQVQISSNNVLRPFLDVEEGAHLIPGELIEGEIDWQRDSDRWLIDLGQGESVTITADGIADTVLAVRRDGELIAASDDEEIGIFGTGARVEFEAPATGIYEVEIGSFDDTRWGYLLLAELN